MATPALPLKVVVIGGSVAGLSVGIALRCVGCEVDIFEQSPTVLRGKGGGLVVQHEMLDWMTSHGIATIETLSIPGVERQFLDRDGRVAQRFPDATPFTSWDAVFHQLLAAFPSANYHHDRRCRRLAAEDGGFAVELTDGTQLRADLIVGADGVGSVVRQQLVPEAVPTYAGYVAWRGVYAEGLAPAHVRSFLESRFTMYQGADFHLLTYLIPGEGGEVMPGKRRLNWVWYWNTDEHTELPDVLTDTDGRRHRSSVPAGMVQAGHVAAVKRRAADVLPAILAELVIGTPAPFLQVVFDLQTPVMFRSNCVLVGDSACVVRPHTAAGTSKASTDAVSLAQHLAADNSLDRALPVWQAERLAVAGRLVHHGRRLARGSGLGVSPA
jgi:2-polyprenyl-6-methoxyphenol hydroxylase-like FAD-dependent oxidoreductase